MSHEYPVKSYYKYRPLYSTGHDNREVIHPHTESIFTKGEIYYSAPSAFNDPFDCNLQMHLNDATEEDWVNHYKRLIPTLPDGAHKQTTLEFLMNKAWQKIDPAHALADAHNELYNQSSVFCLSKRGNSIPMFSYYADHHRGITIEFTFTLQSIPCGVLCDQYFHKGAPYYAKIMVLDVDYPANFPDLNYHRLMRDPLYIKKLIFEKALEWKHEEEYRIFRFKIPAGPVKFDPHFLTGDILGCKTGQSELDLVKGWLKDWPTPVAISKAVQAKDRFELLIEGIDSAGA